MFKWLKGRVHETPYQVLSEDAQDETLVLFMLGQERDHHSHTVNKARYEAMLKTLPPGNFRTRIEGLLAETIHRLMEVDAIIAATKPQMPVAKKLAAARRRVKAKGQI
jgi:hypothetical protein